MDGEKQVGQILVLEPEQRTIRDVLFERISGALMGGAIADALGWPTEFARRPEDLGRVGLEYPVTELRPWHKRTGGRFLTRIDYIQPGDYSDDTQLALAVARSLKPDGSLDNQYFAKQELRYWLDYARGAGATVTAAAKSAARVRSDWRWNYFTFTRGRQNLEYRGAGANGAAMRVAPIALANARDAPRAELETWKNAIITHGHPRAIIGALVYVEALRRLVVGHDQSAAAFVSELRAHVRDMSPPVNDPDIAHWYGKWDDGARTPFRTLWSEFISEMDQQLGVVIETRDQPVRETYRKLGSLDPATKGSGTASVAAALALFLRYGKDFERLTVEGANLLGSDTDTIGAMAGSMTGAWLGFTEIPERWATIIADYTYLNRIAEHLTLTSLRQALGSSVRAKVPPEPGPQMRLLDAMQRQDILDRRPYWHPLFGIGRVIKAESQEVGLRLPRGRVVMATVQFEFGQTCKFSSYRSLTTSASNPRRSARRTRPPQLGLDL